MMYTQPFESPRSIDVGFEFTILSENRKYLEYVGNW